MISIAGEQLVGPISADHGSWKAGSKNLRGSDILVVRFAPDPPPVHLDSGVFIRGGTLLTGSLVTLVGDEAELKSNLFGQLKLKRDDIAGVFSPPGDQVENIQPLAHYSNLLAAALGSQGAALSPGKQNRIVFAGLDELLAQKIMRIGTSQILLSTKDKAVDNVSRQFVRLIELSTPPTPPATDDPAFGPEFIVRLKTGDLLRGRVVRLNENTLTLKTAALGDRDLQRNSLAALFALGGPGTDITWLSSLKPAKAIHTPVFDSEFPTVMDASVDGNDMNVGGVPLERGIGVHSRSEVMFDLDGSQTHFISLCGIDAETNGRGDVTASILADGKEIWKSKTITGKDAASLVSADLGIAKSVTLYVAFGPETDDSGDHFDWGWAAVVKR